jgi:hypothetical protein
VIAERVIVAVEGEMAHLSRLLSLIRSDPRLALVLDERLRGGALWTCIGMIRRRHGLSHDELAKRAGFAVFTIMHLGPKLKKHGIVYARGWRPIECIGGCRCGARPG